MKVIATVKETITSLKDANYGNIIITKKIPQTIWYWSKYLLIVSIIPAVLDIGSITYFVPQIPKLSSQYLPEGSISIKNGQLSSTIKQPYLIKNSDFSFALDTTTSAKPASQSASGLILLADKWIIKDPDGNTRSGDYKKIAPFNISKKIFVDWTSKNQILIWVFLVIISLVLFALSTATYFGTQMCIFFLWGAVLWFVAKITKRPLKLTGGFNLAVYAGVLPLIISTILSIAPNDVISILNIGLFVFFSFSWLLRLPVSSSTPAAPEGLQQPLQSAKPRRAKK
jgi:maltodextrin utilization protein YvdJ